MDPEYRIRILDRLPLGATPEDVKALSFASRKQTIASVLSESNSVLLFEVGSEADTRRISVAEDPVEIAGGGRDVAYVACRASATLDVIDSSGLVKRIDLPGVPHSLAWNGSFNPARQKIMVACQRLDSTDGIVAVVDEATHRIVRVLEVGKQPRGVCLDPQRKHLLVANYGSDSISIIDQSGTKTLATLPTAGRPWDINVSWFDPQDIIISLRGGGLLQRLNASTFPPVLSGLTALTTSGQPSKSMTPYVCMPLDEDHLWLAPDRDSEAIALVKSNDRDLKQIGYHRLGPKRTDNEGLGRVAVSSYGLPGKIFIANRERKELILAEMSRRKSSFVRRKELIRERL